MFDPRSALTSGYHIFLEHDGAVHEQLQTVVAELAGEYGGPLFQPHVTLLAAIPSADEEGLVERARFLASSCEPFTILLDALGAEDKYFRSLYLKAHLGDTLLTCRAKALEVFSMSDDSIYMPHLSLLYGNYDAKEKRKTLESLEYLLPLSFKANGLALWKTPGEADTWQRIGTFSFEPQERV